MRLDGKDSAEEEGAATKNVPVLPTTPEIDPFVVKCHARPDFNSRCTLPGPLLIRKSLFYAEWSTSRNFVTEYFMNVTLKEQQALIYFTFLIMQLPEAPFFS